MAQVYYKLQMDSTGEWIACKEKIILELEFQDMEHAQESQLTILTISRRTMRGIEQSGGKERTEQGVLMQEELEEGTP